MSIELELGEDVVSGKCVRELEVSIVAIGRHGDVPSRGSAAPIAAFTAITLTAGEPGPAPRSAATAAGAQRRTTGGGYFVSRCKAGGLKRCARRSRVDTVALRRKIPAGRRCGPGPLAVRSPSRRPRARPLSEREDHREPMRSTTQKLSIALIVPACPRPSSAGILAHLPGQAGRARPREARRRRGGGGLR
jgi:hypothetical protein